MRAGGAKRILLGCFFFSGFTGLLYQTVWMRLALAQFGVNSSVVATVVTAFMLGLTAGSFLAGRWTARIENAARIPPLCQYVLAELLIAAGGLAVAREMSVARDFLLRLGAQDNFVYSAASSGFLSLILLPFCVAMGSTYPLALAFLRKNSGGGREFSALYLANVSGAVLGVLATSLVLIELLGFRATLKIAVVTNLLVAAAALAISFAKIRPPEFTPDEPRGESKTLSFPGRNRAALFLTGFCSMGLEVVWTRIYTPYAGTFVYTFAGILATYLLFTALGTYLYQSDIAQRNVKPAGLLWMGTGPAAVLSFLAAAEQISLPGPLRIVLGIGPLCAILGYLMPLLIDEETRADPDKAGRMYGINLIGSMAGPILAGFMLIPAAGTKVAVAFFAAPLFLFPFLIAANPVRRGADAAIIVLAGSLWVWANPFEGRFPRDQVNHDHTATVVVDGTDMDKKLYVNGVGITYLTAIAKMMTHFPMAHLDTHPNAAPKGLVICLGMGTSFRSMASWGADATVVELVPSVAKFLPYFFPDAPEWMTTRGPNVPPVKIVIDDGRRFLDRVVEKFDVITVDPPPPVEAAWSSLLYSGEFYASVSKKLKPNGILQMWFPGSTDATINSAVAIAILDAFPHVRAFTSLRKSGVHFLASNSPLPYLDAKTLLSRMPANATRDMTEWNWQEPGNYFEEILSNEFDLKFLDPVRATKGIPPVSDDRPINEFFFLRRHVLTGS